MHVKIRETISEVIIQMKSEKEIQGKRQAKNKKLYLCFVDYQNYQKAFDKVQHDKLIEAMEPAGIPDLERRLIINLYWKQHAVVRYDNDITRDIYVFNYTI